MPAPKATLPVSGTNPSVARRADLEGMVDAVSQALFDQIGAIATGLEPAGNWDASSGAFPSGSTKGSYSVVSTAGTVDGEAFAVGDWLVPLKDAASTSTYAGNWFRGDYSKVVPRKYKTVTDLTASLEVSRGVGSIWEAQGFRYEEADPAATGPDILTTAGGVRLRVLATDAAGAFGVVAGGVINNPGRLNAYNVSGADTEAALEQAIEQSILAGVGETRLKAGLHYVADDLMVYADPVKRSRIGHRISGAGGVSDQAWLSADNKPLGTAIMLAPGKRLQIAAGGVGVLFERLTIAGSVANGPLIEGLGTGTGDFNNDQGGFREVDIINHRVTAPTGGDVPVAVRTNALYTGEYFSLNIVGSVGAYDNWNDNTLSTDSLFYGIGWEVDRTGSGSNGVIRQANIKGFDVGFSIGLSRSAWDADASKSFIGPIIMGPDTQVHYCNKGMYFGNGVTKVTLENPIFEQCSDYFVKLCGEDAHLVVNGGNGDTPARPRPGGSDVIKSGQYVLGDANNSECYWGRATFNGTHFGFVTNAGILIFGGTNAGDVIIDGVTARSNGGSLVAIDDTNGIPDVLIRNYAGGFVTDPAFTAGTFVARVTAKTDRTKHTVIEDGRWMVRLENCGTFEHGISAPDHLDLTNRKYPPSTINFNTISANKSITLGNVSCIGMELCFWKAYAANSIQIVIPTGITLADSTGATFTGVTKAVSAVGRYTLVREQENFWRTNAPFV